MTFRYRNRDARIAGRIYSLKVKQPRDGTPLSAVATRVEVRDGRGLPDVFVISVLRA